MTFTLTVGLGGYGAPAKGTASFDDVSVEKVSSIPQGAVVINLINPQNTSTVAKTFKATPQLGFPDKEIWYFIFAGFLVLVSGVTYYYLRIKPKNSIKATEAEQEIKQETEQIPEHKSE